ncbi:MAG: hypothetical protein OXU23_19980 [Candidatus Poribacteria bacterium]|nr:hypothetical protein [Candidatus Poribacteria bacterium]
MMLKQKRIIAIILAYCLLLGAFLVSRYVLDHSKSLANSFSVGAPLASYQNFHVIAHDLDEMGDLNAECKSQLGDGVRIADWNDIVAYYENGGSLEDFIAGLKMSLRDDVMDIFDIIREPANDSEPATDDQAQESDTLGNEYRITKDGSLRWQDRRHYFVGRHDHSKPPGFLDHDNLNNYQLTLGSWHGRGGYALCYGKLIGIPIPLNKSLKLITPIVSILFVGCLLLCSVLAAMHVLNMPGWLVGGNINALKHNIQKKKNEIKALRKHKTNAIQKMELEKTQLKEVSEGIKSDDESEP